MLEKESNSFYSNMFSTDHFQPKVLALSESLFLFSQ
jgi:hypothetical protein